ncbi:DUF1330 domain-containing protein [Planktotalea arctica]|uniref:DUF1330 domain-containing protein n=1 Tax=Planktotalea arctica TaxID=1481893 RepID=UPI000A16DC52|nr:DUF1330 domain-containing protein [Planktotalea arctica]
MPKGYWIGHVTIDDAETYKLYQAANAAPFKDYGAKFLVRGGPQEVREGEMRPRSVVLEFPTIEAAYACYDSDAYQSAKAIRAAVSAGDLAIVLGYDAP